MRSKVVYQEQIRAADPYGCFSFLFDIIMTVLTGGIWLIWIFIREMRRR